MVITRGKAIILSLLDFFFALPLKYSEQKEEIFPKICYCVPLNEENGPVAALSYGSL